MSALPEFYSVQPETLRAGDVLEADVSSTLHPGLYEIQVRDGRKLIETRVVALRDLRAGDVIVDHSGAATFPLPATVFANSDDHRFIRRDDGSARYLDTIPPKGEGWFTISTPREIGLERLTAKIAAGVEVLGGFRMAPQ